MGAVAGDARFIEPITNLHPHIICFSEGSSSGAWFWSVEPGVNPADARPMTMNENGVKKAPGYNYGKHITTGNATLLIITRCCSKQALKKLSP